MLVMFLTNKYVIGAIILFVVLLLLPESIAQHIPGVSELQRGFARVFTTVYSGVVDIVDRGVKTFQQVYRIVKEFVPEY